MGAKYEASVLATRTNTLSFIRPRPHRLTLSKQVDFSSIRRTCHKRKSFCFSECTLTTRSYSIYILLTLWPQPSAAATCFDVSAPQGSSKTLKPCLYYTRAGFDRKSSTLLRSMALLLRRMQLNLKRYRPYVCVSFWERQSTLHTSSYKMKLVFRHSHLAADNNA